MLGANYLAATSFRSLPLDAGASVLLLPGIVVGALALAWRTTLAGKVGALCFLVAGLATVAVLGKSFFTTVVENREFVTEHGRLPPKPESLGDQVRVGSWRLRGTVLILRIRLSADYSDSVGLALSWPKILSEKLGTDKPERIATTNGEKFISVRWKPSAKPHSTNYRARTYFARPPFNSVLLNSADVREILPYAWVSIKTRGSRLSPARDGGFASWGREVG